MAKRIMSINDGNELFYVGRTVNLQKRFAHYKNGCMEHG